MLESHGKFISLLAYYNWYHFLYDRLLGQKFLGRQYLGFATKLGLSCLVCWFLFMWYFVHYLQLLDAAGGLLLNSLKLLDAEAD